MKAAVYRRYGGPDVVSVAEMARPKCGDGEVLVQVEASSVTTADWRLRAAAFPSFTWLPGRLMFGLFRPRKPVLGGDFAGRVVAVGAGVTRFATGDTVFGFSGHGAHAEFVVVPGDSAIAARPVEASAAEAAAVPFGGLAALVFLRDFARLRPGERVLVVGASGGVGAYAVQVARALGAEVDGVCGPDHLELVRGLGAGRVFDYRREDFAASGEKWDVILDCVGAARLRDCGGSLAAGGRFVPLNIGWAELFQALTNRLRRGPKVVIGVSGDRREDLEALAEMLADGRLRPVIDSRFPLERIREAHALVETRHRAGAVVLEVA